MDYSGLINTAQTKKSLIGILGATKGYGYTLLSQLSHIKQLKLRVICSRHPAECRSVLLETGFKNNKIVYCQNIEQIQEAPLDAIIIIDDYRLMCSCGITSMVECTGNPAVSSDAAIQCLEKGINVYMCSKETDSICGPMLNQIAHNNHAVYALVNGDQPRNLLDLISWAQLLGLEIICAGKASEYDFVWNRDTGDFMITDDSNRTKKVPELIKYWNYQGISTLDARKALLKEFTSVVSADLCEMNLVSNITGFSPAAPFLNYPIAKANELADIFSPIEDGGILKKKGVVDVFFNLREKNEASFCGGEFIVIKCKDQKMWDILIGKGHVVSKNHKYCCIYYPYHFMGMETPISIFLGDLMGIGTHPECRQVAVLAGVAEKDLKKGYSFNVHGHHHAIDGLIPELLDCESHKALAPFYLLNGATLLHNIKKGSPITIKDVDLSHLKTYGLYLEGLALPSPEN